MPPLPPTWMRLWVEYSLNWDAFYFLVWFLLKRVKENGDEKEEGNGKEDPTDFVHQQNFLPKKEKLILFTIVILEKKVKLVLGKEKVT